MPKSIIAASRLQRMRMKDFNDFIFLGLATSADSSDLSPHAVHGADGSGLVSPDLAESAAHTARIASSSPNPVGTAALGLLAKYHCVSGDLAVRPPGIWRKTLVSVFRTQSQAYCSQLERYCLL